ncbi:MAG: TldD/PmbA family protein [Bacteroidales bacterium]|nr:TldD/PmbA family protein [Bacteroidales bacterium]
MTDYRNPIIDKAIDMAIELGADQARAIVEKDIENSVTVLNNEVDKIMSSSSSTLFLQLYIDGRYGSFSTNMLREDELRKFIAEAVECTRLIAPDPCRRLPEQEWYFKGTAADLGQFDPKIESLSGEERIAKALAASQEVWGKHRKLLSIETEWGDEIEYSDIADSQGFRGQTLQSSYTISANCSIKGRGDEKPESWWYDGAMFADRLKCEGIGATALQRGLDSLNPKKLKSGKYDIVIENTVSSKMVSPLLAALSGGNLQQCNSFLRDALGKKVFGDNFTMVDRPHTPGMAGSRWFDDNGLATADRDIIRDGVVSSYFISDYYARKMQMDPTISGASVLRFPKASGIDGKKLNLQDIMKAVDRGILITDFNGGNYNHATGDFSYGVIGFMFENGVPVHPIREMNITGNFIQLWNNLLHIGDDGRTCSKWMIPTLAFADVNFSGI